jgi:hypothetical protein
VGTAAPGCPPSENRRRRRLKTSNPPPALLSQRQPRSSPGGATQLSPGRKPWVSPKPDSDPAGDHDLIPLAKTPGKIPTIRNPMSSEEAEDLCTFTDKIWSSGVGIKHVGIATPAVPPSEARLRCWLKTRNPPPVPLVPTVSPHSSPGGAAQLGPGRKPWVSSHRLTIIAESRNFCGTHTVLVVVTVRASQSWCGSDILCVSLRGNSSVKSQECGDVPWVISRS